METWDVGIQTTFFNQTFSILILGTNPNITVDWGNGLIETFTTTGIKTRTYATIGSYTVKIRGSFSANGNIRLGTSTEEKSRVWSTSIIPTIPGLTSFSYTFFECASLESIPEGLFANNTAVTSFDNTFLFCTSLTSIPPNLFANNTAATNFNNTFASCTSLTSIPSDLFNNNVIATNFSGTFDSCNYLINVPANLFANNIAATDFSNVFGSVILTTTTYSNLLINIASNAANRQNNVPFGGGASFYNLAGQTARQTLQAKGWTFNDLGLEVTTWDLNIITFPFSAFSIDLSTLTSCNFTIDWGDGNVETFTTPGTKTHIYFFGGNYTVKLNGSFSSFGNISILTPSLLQSVSVIPFINNLGKINLSFSSLEFIPENLFINNPQITDFSFCFQGTLITSIPENLFANNINATSFEQCFAENNLLTTIPSNLFANNTAVTTFRSTFSSCPLLTSIPSNLFSNNVLVNSFLGCFSNCTSLTSIPAGLFESNTSVTTFSSTFQNCISLTSVPADLFFNNTAATSFGACFLGVTLTTASYSNLLINMASNAANRQNNVPFGGGASFYNLAGQTARQTLQAKGWTFIDLGLEERNELLVKILNVGNNICSESNNQTCFKIINIGNNICNVDSTNCIKIYEVR
jgi:hypothetical protein